MINNSWLWWSTLIILLLRNDCPVFAEEDELIVGTTTSAVEVPNGPKSADELGVPRCTTNHECVNNGVCVKGDDGYGRCLCPRSCTALIPMGCKPSSPSLFHRKDFIPPCLSMGTDYKSRFRLSEPQCYLKRCVCPPMFDDVMVSHPIKQALPTKCDKRELKVTGVILPSDKVSKGSDVTIYCCINIDPSGHIDASGVWFIQNETISREPTSHPFKEGLSDFEQLTQPSCWELTIKNVQPSDSGPYMCVVNPTSNFTAVNHTTTLRVKDPQMFRNISIVPTNNSVLVSWESQDESTLRANLKLYRRSDTFQSHQVILQKKNVTSPVNIVDLRPATTYSLNIEIVEDSSGKEQQSEYNENARIEHFTTLEGRSHAPKASDIHVGSSGSSLNCEIEWKQPPVVNGRIVKYYVRVQGALRRPKTDGTLVSHDFPPSLDKKCANYDETEQASLGINPIDFSNELYFCKFGPLKPNRNYSVTVWAENGAGKSAPLHFNQQCVTPYAQPDEVERPVSSIGVNHTSFHLSFNSKIDDTNGPVSCYYVAVVPLPTNVSIDSLPHPQDIVVDKFARAFSNNMQYTSSSEKKIYIAYIAESYEKLPEKTVIGDGDQIADLPPCSVPYLSRHRAEDSALKPAMKYTGFLIVRVDRDPSDVQKVRASDRFDPRRRGSPRFHRAIDDHWLTYPILTNLDKSKAHRSMRQLPMGGPVYGFSPYFKPILLDEENSGSAFTVVIMVVVSFLVFVLILTMLGIFLMQRRGELSNWCPPKLIKVNNERTLLKPTYQPIAIEDLPSEYLIRHRDSDFMFSQEYEALPTYQLEATASIRKENMAKNRYNDIKAYDATRVKLKKIDGDECSDYINANAIQTWGGKKHFIATQAPVERTVNDFWRMVYEHDCRIIVMVANLVEKGRIQCEKYWPDETPRWYGNVRVEPVKSDYNAYYTVRTFDICECDPTRVPPGSFRGSVESNVGSEYANVPSVRNGKIETSFGGDSVTVRRVQQYHFTNWSDFRAPECTTGLLRFLHRLRGLPDYNNYPIVIHCSAGVGRTGTFIAIDSMLDECIEHGKVDIFGFVSGLRKQRNLMVQTNEQYVFIYKALAEWYLFGDTDMKVDQLKDHYRQLLDPCMRDRCYSTSGTTRIVVRPDSGAPLNGLEAEFLKLNQTLESTPSITFARKEENIMKNRFEAAVPYDRNRVVLNARIGFSDSTYINASEFKGYFYPYIMCQDPVSECTVFDFWRMISDRNVTTIVMLSSEEEWSVSEKYWPEDKNCDRVVDRHPHQFVIRIESEERFPTYVQRKLVYQNAENASTSQWQSVTQFSITDWPSERVVPTSTESVIRLIGLVLQEQSLHSESGPIVLHCRDGSSQTGVFCCISLLLERLKAEQRVDIFQTVKQLQSQRPMMFTKLEEYQFCYRAVLDYVKRDGLLS